MEDLTKVYLRPLPNGNFVLEAYNGVGYHIEREIRFVELKSCMLIQEHMTLEFKKGKAYRIWLCDLDFSRTWIPLYVRGGLLRASYFHILYALAAEVSYYVSGFSKEINRKYLRNTREFADFWKNQDMEVMLGILLRVAGAKERGRG